MYAEPSFDHRAWKHMMAKAPSPADQESFAHMLYEEGCKVCG